MKEVTKKELLVLIKPDHEEKDYEKAEDFVVGIPIDSSLDAKEAEKAVDAWLKTNVKVCFTLDSKNVEGIPFECDFRHDLDEAGEPFTIYWQRNVPGAEVMAGRLLAKWDKMDDEGAFVADVINVFEMVMKDICENEEDSLMPGFTADEWQSISWEIKKQIDAYQLANRKITSETVTRKMINAIFAPFLQILDKRGWNGYSWDRYKAFDDVQTVFENRKLIEYPPKGWWMKISYSFDDSEYEKKFATEEEAWAEAKKFAMEEVQTVIDEEDADADLKFYANQKHIELHYWKDDTWAYYDVIKK